MNFALKLITGLMFVYSINVYAKQPESWGELIEVKSKRMDAVYLLPGVDFRPYTKVIIDPSVVAFQKNWLRSVNSSGSGGLSNRRINASDAQEILQAAQQNFDQVFANTLTKKGFIIVSEPGPDVLHITPEVVNLYINAPDVNGPSMSRTYVMEAGEGTIVLEARDSQTNTILARVIDERETRSSGRLQLSNQATNINDFRALVNTWATIFAKGLDELKESSPVPIDLKPEQKL